MRGAVVVVALVLAGCNTAAPVQPAQPVQPAGQAFSYSTKDSVNTYTCAPKGPGGATPQARAKAMHSHFQAETDRFAEKQTADMMKAYNTQDPAQIKASEKRLDAAARAFADRMYSEGDSKFKCVLSSSRDL